LLDALLAPGQFFHSLMHDKDNIHFVICSISLGECSSLSMNIYNEFQKSDAKIQMTITTAYLIRIKYPLTGFNYHLSDVNIANFNKIHRISLSKQQLF